MLLCSNKQKEITKSKQGALRIKSIEAISKGFKEMDDQYQGGDSTLGRGKRTNKDKGDLNNQGRDIVRMQEGRYLTNKYQGNRNRIREGKSSEDPKRIGKGIVKKELKKDVDYRKYKTEIKKDKDGGEGSKTIQIIQEKKVKTKRNNPLVIIKPEKEEDSSDAYTDSTADDTNAYNKQQAFELISSLQDSAEYEANQNTAESRDIRKMMQQMIQYLKILDTCSKFWHKYEVGIENLFTNFEKLQEELEDKLRKACGRVVTGEIQENKRDVNKAENIELIEEKETDVNMNNKVEVASKKKAQMNDKKKDKPRVSRTKIIKQNIKIVKGRDPKLDMKLIVRLENLKDEQISRELENNRSKRARKQTKFFGERSNEADDVIMADRPKFVDENLITKVKRRNAYYHKKILEEGITPRRMNPRSRAIRSRKCMDTKRSKGGGRPRSSIYASDSSD
ncbi:CAP-Gly domain-containing linker protein 1 [Cephus cinctus]|uniref:CAP-Gly domain-containing linker protein 1 n=1 Tax=Cephus cinctus TaxID=211228 RepID=A0AAJ7BJL4_CEPCN|nr:CAP-Gly domain-containing linker protein 1 [Cephus cinctus]XP_015587631.1 CAP-Gly domain-containing linker protein 1 [Cephus cinctus]